MNSDVGTHVRGRCQKEGKGDMKQPHLLVLGHDLGLQGLNRLLRGSWEESLGPEGDLGPAGYTVAGIRPLSPLPL